jgi:hypothetical protein
MPEDSERSSIYGYDLAGESWFWTGVDIAGWYYDFNAGGWRMWGF